MSPKSLSTSYQFHSSFVNIAPSEFTTKYFFVNKMDYLRDLGWEEAGQIIVRLRRGGRTVRGVRVSRTMKKKLIRQFENAVCTHNRKQPIDSDIRSMRDGKLIKPGRKNYYETLRRCRITRHYSTCREILNPNSRLVVNPRNSHTYLRGSRGGKLLVRRCVTH